jgi:hypothetical protein
MSTFARSTRISRLLPWAICVAAFALYFEWALPLAHTPAVGAASGEGFEAADFAGTWTWMFEGKPFATTTLERKGEQFTGSVSNSFDRRWHR